MNEFFAKGILSGNLFPFEKMLIEKFCFSFFLFDSFMQTREFTDGNYNKSKCDPVADKSLLLT